MSCLQYLYIYNYIMTLVFVGSACHDFLRGWPECYVEIVAD